MGATFVRSSWRVSSVARMTARVETCIADEHDEGRERRWVVLRDELLWSAGQWPGSVGPRLIDSRQTERR